MSLHRQARVDLTKPEEAIVFFINSTGQVFTYPVEVMDDPHPERGSRKGLTSEGGTVEPSAYVPSKGGSVPVRIKATLMGLSL